MNILDLIEQETHNKFAKRGDKEFHGTCPFCHCTGNHFVVFTRGRERYWCRQCNRKGDAIQFLRDYCHYSYRQAREYLGLPVDDGCVQSSNNRHNNNNRHNSNNNNNNHNTSQSLMPPSEVWTNCAAAFLATCQAALWSPPGGKALAWLRETRGLTDVIIHQAALGYNDHDQYVDRQGWGLPPQTNERGKPKRLWLPRGIVIPWYIDGELWAIRIRRPPGVAGPKYYFVPGGQANAMYNGDTISPGQAVALFEGEINALTLLQHAGTVCAAVATGSTHAARRLRWVARLSTASTVLVCYDSDAAGDQAAGYWVDTLSNARRWRPYWSDANDMAQDGVDLRKWVIAGLPNAMLEPPTQPAPALTPQKRQVMRTWLGHIGELKFGVTELIEIDE